jgi:TPP-dependent pyruvate/acetoin dehydrogenase alpha subunit
VIENNGYGLSTPTNEQYKCESLVERARGYGMDGIKIDGNNILSVLDTLKGVRDYCITYQKPYLIECTTFRMRGHEEASGTKYVPKELMETWALKDPVDNYERYLEESGVLNPEAKEKIIRELREPGSHRIWYIADAFRMGMSMDEIYALVNRNFDFSVANIISELDLLRPMYRKTANFGHFGKDDYPWEKIIDLK